MWEIIVASFSPEIDLKTGRAKPIWKTILERFALFLVFPIFLILNVLVWWQNGEKATVHLFWKEGPENWTTGELILYTFLYTMFLSATVFVTVGALARSEIKRLKKDLKEKDKTIALKDQKLDMCVEAMKKVHVPMPMDKLVGKKLVGFSEAAHSPGVLIASARRVIS